MDNTIIPGTVFRHYKGNLYAFLHQARHSETLEPLVVYKALYGDQGIWVKPGDMFFGMVTAGDKTVRRFEVLPV